MPTRSNANRRSASPWARSVRVIAVLATLAGSAVVGPPAGAAPRGAFSRSPGPTLPTNVSKTVVEAIVKHPCTLLTERQADAAARVRFTQEFDLTASGLCEYVDGSSSNATLNVYVELGTVAQELPPKSFNIFTPEPSLGRGVVWVLEKGGAKGSGELWFPLGKAGGKTYSVQIELAEGGLSEAAAVARDCFSHM
jgi:hypothetical protein